MKVKEGDSMMKKKGSLLAVLFVLILAVSAVTLTACGHEHEFGAWTVVTAPTADAAGKATRECSKGDATEEIELKALTDSDFWTVTTNEATHTSEGSEVYTAKNYAGVTVTVTLPKTTQHVYGAWSVTTKPTTAAKGEAERSCTANDDTQTVELEVLTDTEFWSSATSPASHTKKGETVYTAKNYEDLTVTVEIPMQPHTYGNWTITTEPSLTSGGKIKRTCTEDDGGEEELDINALSDTTFWTLGDKVDFTHDDDGSQVYTCEYVSYTLVLPKGHTYGNWTITTEPTTAQGGVAERVCSVDGNKDEVDIPVLTDASVWTAQIISEPTDTAPGETKYTSVYGEVTVSTLNAPFVNKTYYNFGFDARASENRNNRVLPVERTWDNISLTLGSDGVGTGKGFPYGGMNTFTYVDTETGKIHIHTVSGSSTYDYDGYVHAETGIVVMLYAEGRPFILTPYAREVEESKANEETEELEPVMVTRAVSDAKASAWGNAIDWHIAIDYTYAEGQSLKIYITNNEVYFDTTFTDNTGAAVNADACYNNDYLFVNTSTGSELGAFGFDGESMRELDGLQGVYTGTLEGADESLELTGYGVVKKGAIRGTYVEEDLDVLEVYLGGAYYRVTLSGNSFTAEKPTVKITFESDIELGYTEMDFNIKVVADLPTPVSEGRNVFKGWYLDAEFLNAATDYIPTAAATLYARWEIRVTVNVHVDDGDVRELELAVGDILSEHLPVLKINPRINGEFGGWYSDADCTQTQDTERALAENNDGLDIYAKWNSAGTWKIEQVGTYYFAYDSESGEWKSNNQGQKSSSAIMQIHAIGGTVMLSFEYGSSSEGTSDAIEIRKYETLNGNNTQETKYAGSSSYEDIVWHTYSVELKAGNVVKITYGKDSSVDRGTDTAYIKNLTVNGRTVTLSGTVDFLEGDYTCEGKDDLVIDGYGHFTWGSKAGTYVKNGDDFDMYVVADGKNVEYYVLTLGEGSTYSVVKPEVVLTLNYDSVERNAVTVDINKNAVYALSAGVDVAGFVFRGWYTSADFSGEAITEITAGEAVELYAKYDAVVTLTYDYQVSGAEPFVVGGLGAGDKIGALHEIPESVTVAGSMFVGWFTKNGAGNDWGVEVTADTVVSENTTVYAKWVVPHVMIGVYRGGNLDPDESGIVKENDNYSETNTFNLTVNFEGVASGWNNKNGSIENYNSETGSFMFQNRYGNIDVENGFMYLDWQTGKSDPYHDILFCVRNDGDVKAVSTCNTAWDKGCTKLIRVIYSDDSVKDVLIYNRKVYGNVSWSAKNAAGIAVTDVTKLADDVSYIIIKKDATTLLELARANNNLVAVNGTQGIYTCDGRTDIFLNGAGAIGYDGKAGTLTAVSGQDNVYTAVFADASYTLTIDVSAKTYTLADNKVTVSYNFAGLDVALPSEQVYSGVAFTLPTAGPEIEGYVFRGWYDNEGLSGNSKTSITPDGNTVVYAKYDKAVTLTYDYQVGETTYVQRGLFANDRIDTLHTLPSNVTNGNKTFIGWFTKDGAGDDWGSEVTADTVVTDDTTVYAKWMVAHALYGTYRYANLDPSESGVADESDTFTEGNSSNITIDALGNMTGGTTGTIDYNETTGMLSASGYNGAASAAAGILYLDFRTNQTEPYHDIKLFVKDSGGVSAVSSYSVSWDKGCTKLVTLTYSDDSVKTLFIYNRAVYAPVTWTAAGASGAITDVKQLKANMTNISISYGSTVFTFGKVGNNMELSDGTDGTYANDAVLGNIVSDGYGRLTVNDATVNYVLEDDKLRFVANNRMYVVSLDKSAGTYTQEQDGYAGTYTLPEGGTLTLDGLGGAGGGKTYGVDGATLTVYDGANKTAYGIDVDTKTLLGKSVFAGLTFRYSTSTVHFITFNDAPQISGRMTLGSTSWTADFTGELSGTTLTLTITAAVGCGASAGDKIIFTVSGDTLTIVSEPFSYVDVDSGWKYTCAGFSL